MHKPYPISDQNGLIPYFRPKGLKKTTPFGAAYTYIAYIREYPLQICFRKVIPPTLSASSPNVVSAIKSCQSSKKPHCLLKARSFGSRIKRIEISKVRSVTSAFVPFHKIGFQNIQVNVTFWQPAFRNFRANKALFSSLLYTFTANSSALSCCCSDSTSVKLRDGCTSLRRRL